MDPTWVHPFTALVSGPTQSGKSVFVERFINNCNHMMHPSPNEIVWCYGSYQPMYDRLKEKNVKFIEGIPDFQEWDIDTRRLVILDDLMHEANRNISQLFTKGSHHRNISVIMIVQNIFSSNKEHRTISLNSSYMVIFKNVRDKTQIAILGKQMFPGQASLLTEAYKSAISEPYGYLLIDLKNTTPEHLRLRSNIFPGELQSVYIPKNHTLMTTG